VKILLATRNRKKLIELQRILDAASLAGVTVVGLADAPPYRLQQPAALPTD